uniref:hypothetical protein n=1 Tax=uncultured Caulobacter sp. TaxID=158749 RepID=UPI0025ECB8FE|nr:hypothetical protein [uncultured Caulobacter sp.]
MRLLLSIFSFGLIALGLGLICDTPAAAWRTTSGPGVSDPRAPSGELRIQLVGPERFAAGAFGPLELPPAICPVLSASAIRSV